MKRRYYNRVMRKNISVYINGFFFFVIENVIVTFLINVYRKYTDED